MSRPAFLPETRQFSQADGRVVQRQEGISGPGDEGVESRDIRNGNLDRYADITITPGKYDESFPATATPQASMGGVVTLVEKDLGFMCHAVAVDNWTNQWLYEPNLKRFVPPYSGPWIISAPRGFQMARLQLKAPVAFAPAGAVAGEFVYIGWHEAYLSPMNGISTTVKTPVTA